MTHDMYVSFDHVFFSHDHLSETDLKSDTTQSQKPLPITPCSTIRQTSRYPQRRVRVSA